MAKKEKATFKDLLMRAFKAKDADEIEKIADEAAEELTKDEGADNSGDTHIHLHTGGELGNSKASQEGNTTVDEEAEAEKAAAKAKDDDLESRFASLEARLTALEAAAGTTGDADMNEETEDALEEEAPANAAKEEARKAKDSAFLVDSFQETVSLAEIIAPGIRIPTFDRSVRPAQSLRTICNLRSSALDLAYAQPVTRGMIEEVLAGKTFDTKTMTCDAARNLFRSVALLKKAANNSNINSHSSFSATVNDGQQKRGVKSIADLNKANQAYYAGK